MALQKIEWLCELTVGLQRDGTVPVGGIQATMMSGYVDTDDPNGAAVGLSRGGVMALTPAQAAAMFPGAEILAQVQAVMAERDAAVAVRNSIRSALALAEDAGDADITAKLAETLATAAAVPGLQTQLNAARAKIDAPQGTIDKGQPTRENLLRYVSQVSAQRAASGVTVNGIAVSTDTDSLTLLAGAVQLCQIDPTTVIDWHIPGKGSIELTAPQVIGLGLSVGRYVQAGFATVATLVAGIQADVPTIVTFEQIDAADWPSPAITAS